MARTKATCRDSNDFLSPRLALLEAARAVPPTSSATAATAAVATAPTSQEPAPPFNAEEMRSFLSQTEAMSSPDAAPISAEQAVAFSRGFRRYMNTITETLVQQARPTQVGMHTVGGMRYEAADAPLFTHAQRQELRQTFVQHPPLRTHAERQELRKKRIEAKEKIQDATDFYESTSEALRKHKTLVQAAENFVNERREALDDAECDYKVKRARLDVVECELELAKSDLKDAKNAYESIKAQTERQ